MTPTDEETRATFNCPHRLVVYAVRRAEDTPVLPGRRLTWPWSLPNLPGRRLLRVGVTPAPEPLSLPPDTDHLYVVPRGPEPVDDARLRQLVTDVAGDDRVRGLHLVDAQISNRGLRRAATLPLEELNLWDTELKGWSALKAMKQLRWIGLQADHADDALAHLPAETLEGLSLSGGPPTPGTLARFEGLVALETSDLDAETLAVLRRLPRLRHAAFRAPFLRDAAAIELPALTSLTMVGPSLDPSSLADALVRMPHLTALAINGWGTLRGSDRLWTTLRELPRLRALRVSECLGALDRLPDVEDLEVGFCVNGPCTVAPAALEGLRRVRQLSLRSVGLSFLDLDRLPDDLALERLGVDGLSGDEGFDTVERFTGLRELRVSRTLFDDAEPLLALPELRTLEARETGLDDTDAALLTRLPLRRLDLRDAQLTDAGFDQLARLESLEELQMGGAAFKLDKWGDQRDYPPTPTDAALSSLSQGCPRLRSLSVEGKHWMSEEALAAFCASKPSLEKLYTSTPRPGWS